MRVARIIFASLLALLAVLNACGYVLLIRDHESLTTFDHMGGFPTALCLGASAFYYFRPRAYWDANLSCPSCRQTGSLHMSFYRRPRINIFALVLTGILGSILYMNARKQRFQCESCKEFNTLRTVGGWLSLVWLLLIGVALAAKIYDATRI